MVQVGTAGRQNLEAHRASKACRTRANGAKGAKSNRPEKTNQSIDAFFKPWAPLNPFTVSAPPPIHPGDPFALTPEYHRGPLASPEQDPEPARLMAESSEDLTATPQGVLTVELPTQHILDKEAVRLLQELEAAVKRIPSDIPAATPEHQLNIFAADPHTCVAEPGEDDWLIINQMMKSSFGWGEVEMATVIPKMLNRGAYGLDGFICFMMFFVRERGLQGALFETKVKAILKGIEDR